jgi:hypothetical protein
MSSEKRGAKRRDLRWNGLIVDLAGSIVGPCRMVNVSATGANLLPRTSKDVPDSFVVLLAKNAKVRRKCEVVWRLGKSIGIRFGPSSLPGGLN